MSADSYVNMLDPDFSGFSQPEKSKESRDSLSTVSDADGLKLKKNECKEFEPADPAEGTISGSPSAVRKDQMVLASLTDLHQPPDSSPVLNSPDSTKHNNLDQKEEYPIDSDHMDSRNQITKTAAEMESSPFPSKTAASSPFDHQQKSAAAVKPALDLEPVQSTLSAVKHNPQSMSQAAEAADTLMDHSTSCATIHTMIQQEDEAAMDFHPSESDDSIQADEKKGRTVALLSKPAGWIKRVFALILQEHQSGLESLCYSALVSAETQTIQSVKNEQKNPLHGENRNETGLEDAVTESGSARIQGDEARAELHPGNLYHFSWIELIRNGWYQLVSKSAEIRTNPDESELNQQESANQSSTSAAGIISPGFVDSAAGAGIEAGMNMEYAGSDSPETLPVFQSILNVDQPVSFAYSLHIEPFHAADYLAYEYGYVSLIPGGRKSRMKDLSNPTVIQPASANSQKQAGLPTFENEQEIRRQADRRLDQEAHVMNPDSDERSAHVNMETDPENPDFMEESESESDVLQAQILRLEELTGLLENEAPFPEGVSVEDEKRLEGLLFIAGEEGVTLKGLLHVYDHLDQKQIEDMLEHLAGRYENHGVELACFAGAWKLVARSEVFPYAQKLYENIKAPAYSNAALETLAIIAYRQPITRVEIEQIRGVACDAVLKKLVARDLVVSDGHSDAPGRPLLYRVTETFMDAFGLASLKELPELENPSDNLFDSLEQIEENLNADQT